jgi:hypothetical protein
VFTDLTLYFHAYTVNNHENIYLGERKLEINHLQKVEIRPSHEAQMPFWRKHK